MKKYEIMKVKFHRTVQNSTHYTKYTYRKPIMNDLLLADCACLLHVILYRHVNLAGDRD